MRFMISDLLCDILVGRLGLGLLRNNLIEQVKRCSVIGLSVGS